MKKEKIQTSPMVILKATPEQIEELKKKCKEKEKSLFSWEKTGWLLLP
jgi:hypothetical protein